MSLQATAVGLMVLLASLLGGHNLSAKPRVRLLRGLTFGTISGILSAHSLLVAKVAVELLVRTIVDGKNQFDRWQSWFILFALIVLALTQLYFLHCGLKLVSTSVLYPLVFCVYNIIAILDGLIYFHQTSRLTALAGWLVALGTVILLSGVLALSWRLNDEQSHPAVSTSALTPGLGLVDDSEAEDYEDFDIGDEEAAQAHRRLLANEPMTPITHLESVLSSTRGVRKAARLAEENEIWGELDDDSKSDAKGDSSTRLQQRRERREVSGSSSRAGGEPSESTPLLVRTQSLGRRKRRISTGFPGFHARSTAETGRKSSESGGVLNKIFGKWRRKEDDN